MTKRLLFLQSIDHSCEHLIFFHNYLIFIVMLTKCLPSKILLLRGLSICFTERGLSLCFLLINLHVIINHTLKSLKHKTALNIIKRKHITYFKL